MDFARDEDQNAIDELAAKIIGELCTDDDLKRLDREGVWFHDKLWRELAGAALLGLGLDEEVGGSGFSISELCNVARHVGRSVAPIPFVQTAFGAAWALAVAGEGEAHQALLGKLLAGDVVVAVGVEEPNNRDVFSPSTEARASGLHGVKTNVLAAANASHVVVTASGDGGPALYLVDLAADGVSVQAQRQTDGATAALVTLDGAPFERLASDAETVATLVDRLRLGIAAEALGVCERAIEITAEYTRTRKQFGMPIGMFQAVKQRIADAYIATGALDVSVWRAAWLVGNSAEAAEELSIASWWATEAGHIVTTAAQHLHGGMGFDRDYIIHRYFLRAKRLEFTLGSAPEHLAELGDTIAQQGAVQ